MASKEQRKLEKAVALQIIAQVGNAHFLRMGEENEDEPDVIVSVEGQDIGIEVASVYHEGHEKDVWSLRRGQKKPEDLEPYAIFEPDARLQQRIQEEINEKCLHSYAGVEETWLCIHVDFSTVTAAAEIEMSLDLYQIPIRKYFTRIYILTHRTVSEGSGWALFQIL